MKNYNWAQALLRMVESSSLTNAQEISLDAKKCIPAKLLQKKQQEVKEQYIQLYMSTVSCPL